MNKSLTLSNAILELLSDLGRIPEPVFAMVKPESSLSASLKVLRARRKKARRKSK